MHRHRCGEERHGSCVDQRRGRPRVTYSLELPWTACRTHASSTTRRRPALTASTRRWPPWTQRPWLRPLGSPRARSLHCGRDAIGRFRNILMLPDSDRNPTCGGESRIRVSIPSSILDDLRFPVRCMGLGRREMNWAPVPKATIEEDGDAATRKDEIRRSRYLRKGSTGHPESQAETMHRRAQHEFRDSVTTATVLHGATYGLRRCPRALWKRPASPRIHARISTTRRFQVSSTGTGSPIVWVAMRHGCRS
jgi:hypothetical protein